MKIDDNNFRDAAILEIKFGYDWVASENYAVITIEDSNNKVQNYRINGLTKYVIYEDFSAMTIDQCKYIQSENSIYISLDPFNELGLIEENDNYCFWGRSITNE